MKYKYYLTHSIGFNNINSILNDGFIIPGKGKGMSTSKNFKSSYTYLELIYDTKEINGIDPQRYGFSFGLYFDTKIFKDYDFWYTDEWGHIESEKDLIKKGGKKFPKTRIQTNLNKLRKRHLNGNKSGSITYQFVTKDIINIKKYLKFISIAHRINKKSTTVQKWLNKNTKTKKILNEKYSDINILKCDSNVEF